jgi:hypothetical protein
LRLSDAAGGPLLTGSRDKMKISSATRCAFSSTRKDRSFPYASSSRLFFSPNVLQKSPLNSPGMRRPGYSHRGTHIARTIPWSPAVNIFIAFHCNCLNPFSLERVTVPVRKRPIHRVIDINHLIDFGYDSILQRAFDAMPNPGELCRNSAGACHNC